MAAVAHAPFTFITCEVSEACHMPSASLSRGRWIMPMCHAARAMTLQESIGDGIPS